METVWGNKESKIQKKLAYYFGNSEEILRKNEGNFKTGDLWKFFLYFGNNLRKYVMGNFKAALFLIKCQENCKTDNFEKILG